MDVEQRIEDLRHGSPDVQHAIRALGHPDERVRFRAARALVRMCSEARPAIPALVAALFDPSGSVIDSAASALSAIGEPGLDALCMLLADPDPPRRARAALILGRVSGADDRRVESLARALRDPCEEVALTSAQALIHLAMDDEVRPSGSRIPVPLEPVLERAAGILATALSTGPALTRRWAALYLGKLPRLARRHVSDLGAALDDPDPDVREQARWALDRCPEP